MSGKWDSRVGSGKMNYAEMSRFGQMHTSVMNLKVCVPVVSVLL